MQNERRLNFHYASIHGTYWMYFGVLGGFSSVYLLAKGYANSEIGIILAIANTLAILAQPFLADLADRGKKSAIFIMIETITILNLVMSTIMLGMKGKSPGLTIVFILAFALMMTNQPFVNAVNRRLEETGTKIAFGTCRSIGSLAFAVICFFMGTLVEKTSANIIPVMGDIVLILIIISVWATYQAYRISKDAARGDQISGAWVGASADARVGASEDTHVDARVYEQGVNEQKEENISLGDFVKNHQTFFIISLGILSLYFANAVPNTYMAQIVASVGGGSEDAGRMFAALALTEIPTLILFDRLYRRFSCNSMIKLSAVAYVVWVGCCTMAGSVGALYLAQIIHFIAFPLFLPAMVRYVDDNMLKGEAVKGQTLFTIAITLGNMLASLLGGWMLDLLGAKALLIMGTAVSIVGCVIIFVALKRVEKTGL